MIDGSNSSQMALVEAYLARARHDLRLPGLALGIVQDSEILLRQGYGKISPAVVSGDTPFIVGSLSKSFTATALLQLSEAGKLDLDAPIQQYIPWFCIGSDNQASAQITTRHLLTHTSGLSRFIGRQLLGNSKNVGMEQRVRELRKTRLVHPVGTTFEYSNTNYLIAGLLIEIVSGESYGSYIRRHLFEPLGMHHSYTDEYEAKADGLATGHRWWFGLPMPSQVPYLSDALPAAFLISSAHDLAIWLLFHLGDGRTKEGTALLSPQSMEDLHQPYITAGAHSSYTLGAWRVEHLRTETIWRHGGEVANYLAEMVVVPSQHLGVVVLMDCSNGAVAQLGGMRLASNVTRLLLGHQLTQPKVSFSLFYTLVNTCVALLSVLQLWSLVNAARGEKQPPWRIGPFLVGDLLLPLLVLWRLPRLKQVDSPWSLLRWYVPDLTSWIWGMSVLSLLKASLRGWRQVR